MKGDQLGEPIPSLVHRAAFHQATDFDRDAGIVGNGCRDDRRSTVRGSRRSRADGDTVRVWSGFAVIHRSITIRVGLRLQFTAPVRIIDSVDPPGVRSGILPIVLFYHSLNRCTR